MRDPNRIDRVIETIRRFWHQVPDWRLGQVVVNAARKVDTWDCFFIEDDALETGVKALAAEYGPQKDELMALESPMIALNRKTYPTAQDAFEAAQTECGGENFEIRSNPDHTFDLLWTTVEEYHGGES